jgi:hypothetical protein
VLPFDNESPDQADEYLGLSIADELSGALAKIPALRVLGRDSATALKSTKDRRAAAQQLKVNACWLGIFAIVKLAGSSMPPTTLLWWRLRRKCAKSSASKPTSRRKWPTG